MRMGNLLNMYRIVNDSHLRLSDEGFGMRTGLEIRNVSMRGRYAFNQWPLSSTGEIESTIGKVSIAADITVRSSLAKNGLIDAQEEIRLQAIMFIDRFRL